MFLLSVSSLNKWQLAAIQESKMFSATRLFLPCIPKSHLVTWDAARIPNSQTRDHNFKHKNPNKKVGGLFTFFVGERGEPRNTFECSPHPATLTTKWLSFLARSPWVPSQSYSCILYLLPHLFGVSSPMSYQPFPPKSINNATCKKTKRRWFLNWTSPLSGFLLLTVDPIFIEVSSC